MKALTVRQPWAWAIAAGHKGDENRSWTTEHRGPLAIHSSATWDREGMQQCREVLDAEAASLAGESGTAGLRWTVGHVAPGTSYPDEVGMEIPPGWYVYGSDLDSDPGDDSRVIIHVQFAVDGEGYAIDQVLAEQLAGYLGAPVFEGEEVVCETVLTWHPIVPDPANPGLIDNLLDEPVEIPLGEPWVLPGTSTRVGEFRLSTREVPEVSGDVR